MWGIGWGTHWNSQHHFTQKDGWTSACGVVWMIDKPKPSTLPQCRDCKRKLERK